jgi:hypothetical protein
VPLPMQSVWHGRARFLVETYADICLSLPETTLSPRVSKRRYIIVVIRIGDLFSKFVEICLDGLVHSTVDSPETEND